MFISVAVIAEITAALKFDCNLLKIEEFSVKWVIICLKTLIFCFSVDWTAVV
jgi:hypothetical protein